MIFHPSVLRLVLRTRFHLLIWLVGSSAAAFLFITPFPIGQATRQGSSTYYVCDCGAEADGDCQAGDDNNDGTTPTTPWQSYEKARTQFNAAIAAGDEIRFCQGGALDLSSSTGIWRTTNCNAAAPCLIADYAAPWSSGDENRPILWKTGPNHAFEFSNGGNAVHDAGYTLQNLDLRCPICSTTGGWGLFLFNDVNDVLIQNVRFDGFAIGIHLAGSNSCSPADPLCNGLNDRITIDNVTILNSGHQGILGGADDLLITNSYLENNGSGTILDHNIYLSHADGVEIRGNELVRSSVDGSGLCQGVSLVGHGVLRDMLIEGNYVHEPVGGAGQGCWGIAITPAYSTGEGFTNITIRNNRVENVGNVAIGAAACQTCLIENNLIIQQQTFGMTGISIPAQVPGAGDLASQNITIRNNSLMLASGGTAIRLQEAGTSGHVIVSNAIHHMGSASSWNCLALTWPGITYTAIDYNVCGFATGEWADGFGSLVVWQGMGWDGHSVAAAPGFISPLDLFPASGTVPLVNAGHPTLSSSVDYNGRGRDAQPDAGAYEWQILLENIMLPLILSLENE